MTTPTPSESVEIDGESHDSFESLEAADAYMAAASHGAEWRAELDDDARGRALVTATRLLLRQTWSSSTPTTDTDFQRRLREATVELAAALLAGAEVQDRASTANDLRRLTAGPVTLEFAAPASIPGDPGGRFPLIVQELIGEWLGSPGRVAAASAFGTCDVSPLRQGYGLS